MNVGRRHYQCVPARLKAVCGLLLFALSGLLIWPLSLFAQISSWQQNSVRAPATTSVRWKSRDADPPVPVAVLKPRHRATSPTRGNWTPVGDAVRGETSGLAELSTPRREVRIQSRIGKLPWKEARREELTFHGPLDDIGPMDSLRGPEQLPSQFSDPFPAQSPNQVGDPREQEFIEQLPTQRPNPSPTQVELSPPPTELSPTPVELSPPEIRAPNPPREAIQQQPSPTTGISHDLAGKLRRRGDLMLSETTLREAVLTIGQSWGVNIVIGAEVQGAVNGAFSNAPLHEILHAILFANGYGYRAVGDSLAVMKLDTLGDMNPLFKTETIRLQAAKPAEVTAAIKLFRSPQGKVEVIESARTLVVVDLPERIQLMREFADRVDRAAAASLGTTTEVSQLRQVAQFAPQYIDAATIEKAVTNLLSDTGKASVIAEENRLVVYDLPQNLYLVDHFVRQIDVPRQQVRITALIYDVSLEDLDRLGFNWSHQTMHAHGGGTTPGRVFSGGSQTTAGSGNFAIDNLMTVGGADIGTLTFATLTKHFSIATIIKALNSAKDSRLLANPSVVVLNQESASLKIVTEIPFQQLTQTQAGGNIGTTEFKEAGITLSVSPRIAHDGTVRLNVTPQFSRLVGFAPGDNQPIIDKREAQTSVRVANHQTLVIGGLRQRTDVRSLDGIPGLKDKRLFGKLFRSHDLNARESELIVFITPEIISPAYQGMPREGSAFHSANRMLNEVPIGHYEPPRTAVEIIEQPVAPEPQFVPQPNEPPLPDPVRQPGESGAAPILQPRDIPAEPIVPPPPAPYHRLEMSLRRPDYRVSSRPVRETVVRPDSRPPVLRIPPLDEQLPPSGSAPADLLEARRDASSATVGDEPRRETGTTDRPDATGPAATMGPPNATRQPPPLRVGRRARSALNWLQGRIRR